MDKVFKYKSYYNSPLGKIILSANDFALTGLWFDEQKNCPVNSADLKEKDLPVFTETKKWLDMYFSGKEPDFMPKIYQKASPFRMAVWEMLKKIPYGKTKTYGGISKEIATQNGLQKLSAQAVGVAVGHNTILIIVPCHRVVGANGKLTGYSGGLERKVELLRLEQQ